MRGINHNEAMMLLPLEEVPIPAGQTASWTSHQLLALDGPALVQIRILLWRYLPLAEGAAFAATGSVVSAWYTRVLYLQQRLRPFPEVAPPIVASTAAGRLVLVPDSGRTSVSASVHTASQAATPHSHSSGHDAPPQISMVIPRTAREAQYILPILGQPQPTSAPPRCQRFTRELGDGDRVCDGCGGERHSPVAG